MITDAHVRSGEEGHVRIAIEQSFILRQKAFGLESNWVLPPLVFALNGVNSKVYVDLRQNHGTDTLLAKHFDGSLIGLAPLPNGNNALRPRFKDLMSTLRQLGKDSDFALHQDTKLWANAYSSRGYREMLNRGELEKEEGSTSKFKLGASFKKAFEVAVPPSFRLEELLV